LAPAEFQRATKVATAAIPAGVITADPSEKSTAVSTNAGLSGATGQIIVGGTWLTSPKN